MNFIKKYLSQNTLIICLTATDNSSFLMTVGLTNSSINVLESSCSYKSLTRLQPGLERVQGEEADVDGHAGHTAGQQGSTH